MCRDCCSSHRTGRSAWPPLLTKSTLSSRTPLSAPRLSLEVWGSPKILPEASRSLSRTHKIPKSRTLKTLEIYVFGPQGSRQIIVGRHFHPPSAPWGPSRTGILVRKAAPGRVKGSQGAPKNLQRLPGKLQGPPRDAPGAAPKNSHDPQGPPGTSLTVPGASRSFPGTLRGAPETSKWLFQIQLPHASS